MQRGQQMQIAALIACLVIGVGIIVWLVMGSAPGSGRQVVVDPNAKAETMPATTRVAATRPMKTAFIRAVWSEKRDVAVAMLKADPKLASVEVAEDGFSTPLHVAAIHGDIELARLLLENGANLNAIEDRHNGTPLEWAAYGGEVEMVKYLLWRGAIVDNPTREVAAEGAAGRIFGTRVPKARYAQIVKLLNAPRPTTFATTMGTFATTVPATTATTKN